ncbi:hypothetical protein PUR59_00240 [Streptomyces sp. SP18ES09]|uniref:hypothetical protein n=1 Tax=Streptomyces sp. SP18ES09 TaxID=3002532 RepID=UPI002E7AAC89|nr:hypothetical protein [Streptomyces sp. SP18ES09]MEE1813487.1 hypothetical protein [Streptomyces sp. SP18ES09]
MTQPEPPAVGSTWKSRYTTGLRVLVTDTDGFRARIAVIDADGQPDGRGRWTTTQMLQNAYTEEPR